MSQSIGIVSYVYASLDRVSDFLESNGAVQYNIQYNILLETTWFRE